MKEKSPDAIGTHCIIHRQSLMVKIMPDELKSVLNEVIKAVNLIKANSLISCYLLIYVKKIIPNLKLFYCTACEMAFKGKSMKRSFVLRKEIHKFLHEVTNNVRNILGRPLSDMLLT